MARHMPLRAYYKNEGSTGIREENWCLDNHSGESHPAYQKHGENQCWTNLNGGGF